MSPKKKRTGCGKGRTGTVCHTQGNNIIPCHRQIKLYGDASYYTPAQRKKGGMVRTHQPRRKGGQLTPTDLWQKLPQNTRDKIKKEVGYELGKIGLKTMGAVGTIVAGNKLYKHIKGKK